MPFSRYVRTPVLSLGEQYGTTESIRIIRNAIKSGALPTRELVVHERQRLDTLAGALYGDGRYWWILAASSDIGWALQVPPGTIILVPELADIAQLVG